MYRVAGITKQGFYKMRKRRQKQAQEESNLVEIIRQVRKNHPTLCCRLMYHKIKPSFCGRDQFERICGEHGFLIKRSKSRRRTTDSRGVIRFENLVEDLELTGIDQVWSSDITYYEVGGRFYYITFVLDCHSRRILGHQVSKRLQTEHTTLPALKRALRARNHQLPPGVIFHSDGGGQYYDDEFLALTADKKMQNSMCEYAYENGKVERLHGVIKNNYLTHWEIKSFSQLKNKVDRAVWLYNHDKPHTSLNKMTPIEFEAKMNNFNQQNRSTMKESVDAIYQINRASSPALSEAEQVSESR